MDTQVIRPFFFVSSSPVVCALYRLSSLLFSRIEDAAHEGPLQQVGFQGSLLDWALEAATKKKGGEGEKEEEEEKMR